MYSNILVTLDGSKFAEDALPHATTLAKVFNAPITVIYVIEPVGIYQPPGMVGPVATMPIDYDKINDDAKDYLAKTVCELKAAGLDARSVLRDGDAASQIIDYSIENGSDLIVMTTHGRSGILRWVYGSVADRILKNAKCPILMIRSVEKE